MSGDHAADCAERRARACADALAALDAVLDREPDAIGGADRAAEVAAHLDACRPCGLTADEIESIKDAVARGWRGADPASVHRLRELAARLTARSG